MSKMIGGLFFSLLISMAALAEDLAWPDKHPCTGEGIPLTSEKSIVLAIECIYKGRVANVVKVAEKVSELEWFYRLKILVPGGRVKMLDVHPQTGLPIDPVELEAVYETLDR